MRGLRTSTKRYDRPTTPYRRVLARDDVDGKTKTALTTQFETLKASRSPDGLDPACLADYCVALVSSSFSTRSTV